MVDLTLLFVFGPPLVITLFLLLFMRSRIYGRISKTLILVLWATSLISVLELLAAETRTWTGSAGGVDDGVLAAQFGLSVFQTGAYLLDQLLLWGFVAFFAVIIGSIYLLITCWRKGGSLVQNMNQVSFKGNLENPLKTEFDIFGSWSYLIIGLVTMPSMISIIIGLEVAGVSIFSLSVVTYVLLFYRFSLLAYTRIARKADLHLGDENLGRRYEKRMLGWFTILNLVISVVLLAYTLLLGPVVYSPLAVSMIIELKGLLAAVLILPFAEGFAAFFFGRFWRFWSRLGTRLHGIKWKPALYSLTNGLLVGGACFILFYAVLSFVTAGTTFFYVFGGDPLTGLPIFNNQVGAVSIYGKLGGYPSDLYSGLLLPFLWALVCLFLFQFIKVLVGGSLTQRKGVAPEYSIVAASMVIAVLIWVIMPATNFFLAEIPAQLTSGSGLSTLTYFFVPNPLEAQFVTVYYVIPAPTVVLYILFLDFPVWVLGSLFLMYFFKFRRELIPPRKELGVFRSADFFRLFVSFCVVVVASVGTIAAMDPTTPLGQFVHSLLSRLWFPHASESYLFAAIGPWYVFFHNMLRFLLLVFAPIMFMVSIVGIRKWLLGERVQNIKWYILAIVLLLGEAVFFIDRFTLIAIIVIPIVLAFFYRLFYQIVKRASPKTVFRTTALKIAFYSLILSEIYSTAIAIADRYMFPLSESLPSFASGGNLGLLLFLLILVPHGLVEIPAAMLGGMIGLYIARRMTARIDEDEKKLDKFMAEGNKLFWSGKIWWPILFVTVFFAIAAAIEIYVAWGVMEPLANSFGFA